jgi:hypothetical protein
MQPWQLNAQQAQQDAQRSAEQAQRAAQSAMDQSRRNTMRARGRDRTARRGPVSGAFRLLGILVRLAFFAAVIIGMVVIVAKVNSGK